MCKCLATTRACGLGTTNRNLLQSISLVHTRWYYLGEVLPISWIALLFNESDDAKSLFSSLAFGFCVSGLPTIPCVLGPTDHQWRHCQEDMWGTSALCCGCAAPYSWYWYDGRRLTCETHPLSMIVLCCLLCEHFLSGLMLQIPLFLPLRNFVCLNQELQAEILTWKFFWSWQTNTKRKCGGKLLSAQSQYH